MQLTGVAVQPFSRAGETALHTVALFLHSPAATLQDLHPDVGARLAEKRQPSTEPIVVERLRTNVGEQIGQVLLALGGQAVDPLSAARPRCGSADRLNRLLLRDPPGFGEAPQRGIE